MKMKKDYQGEFLQTPVKFEFPKKSLKDFFLFNILVQK